MLNRVAFKFAVDINKISSVSTKTATTTPETSFLSAFQGLVQQKTAQPTLTIDPKLQQFTAVPLSLKEKVQIPVPHEKQYHNECGPTSLDMIFEYYGIHNIDHHNMFSSETFGLDPTSLREKALQQKFTVRQENNGTLKDLARLSKNGIPSLILGSVNGDITKGHWMVFDGYETDDAGNITKVFVNDPNSMTTRTMSVSEFNKFWGTNLIGGHNYYMAMAKPGTFKETFLTECLPHDEISSSFAKRLNAAHNLVQAGYSLEKYYNKISDVVDHGIDYIADALEDAWDEVSGWFS